MPWREPREEAGPERKAKVCSVCQKIILRRDDLFVRDGKTYCGKHLPRD